MIRWIKWAIIGWSFIVVLSTVPAAAVTTLGDSVDAPSLNWATTTAPGAAAWGAQTAVTHDGVDAAQSGTLLNGQSSWLETQVIGDNRVSFWWRVSSEPGYDFFTVSVDGVPQGGAASPISGEVGWTLVTLKVSGSVGATHTIRWEYAFHAVGAIPPNASAANPGASNSGWLDEVVVTPALDADGDGFFDTVDCDDKNPAINPGATEIINDGKDQDCTGRDATAAVAESVDNPALTWTFAGNLPWDGQALTQAHDGVDAAQSSPIAAGQSSEIKTTVNVTLPNNQLSFWWRVSSEQDFDVLTVYVDDVAAGAISGEKGWTRVLLPLSVGAHTIRWVYGKDIADSAGNDAGWLDQVVMVSAAQIAGGTPAEGVDATALAWTTGGNASWAYQTNTTLDGVDAAQSGAISTGQSSWLETTVNGDNQVSFWWRVSSEPGYDFLTVSVDGIPQSGSASPISGEVGWQPITLNISGSGAHTISWQYAKHTSGAIPPNTLAANPGASDSGWVDRVVVTPAVDADKDGFTNTVDCNDADPAINPGATEVLSDGIDQDCTGRDATASVMESLDNPALTWTFAGNRPWDGQALTLAHDQVDAAQSSPIADNQGSEIKTTVNVTLPNNQLSFWWRVSSEQDFDVLTVYVDDVAAGAISGEVGWTRVLLPLSAGSHTIRWLYSKDVADSAGSDAGWLDQVFVVSAAQVAGGSLAEGVDATALAWTTGGNASWAYQTTATYDGVDAAQSGAISTGQSSSLQTTINGDNQVSFWWRVSSAPGYDFFTVSVDGIPQTGTASPISGEQGWTLVTLNVPGSGPHTLNWEYSKPAAGAIPPNSSSANPGASDSGWLDQVVVTPAVDGDSDGFKNTVDCNDADPAIHPGATEVLRDGIDQDCTGRDATASVAEGLDNPTLTWSFAGAQPWDGQATAQAHDGVDAAQSSPVGDGQSSEIVTTVNVTLPNNQLSFWWRVSSEQDFDILTVYVDDVAAGAISGEVGWTRVILPLSAGSHTIRWVYAKDIAGSAGSDAGWLDQVFMVSAAQIAGGTLAEAVDAPALTWTTAGDVPWAYQTATTYDGLDAAQSGAIANGQSSTLQTTISGDSKVSFWWKVSSETNYDFLTVYVDGVSQGGAASPISGEQGWVPVTLNVAGSGAHIIKWEYAKHTASAIPPNSPAANPGASDKGWVDQVVVTPAVDADGDTFYNTVDCDDANASIHPGATEILNDGIDQDCTGRDATATVAASLDNPALTWTFAGNLPWDGQATALAHDGVDAAQSSPIGDGQSSEILTTVNATLPNNQLSFWWRVSSELDFDLLTVYVDDVAAGTISGEVGWTRVILPLPVGSHTIRWVYGKDSADSAGSDSAWLDQVLMVAPAQSVSGTLAEAVDAIALPWTTGVGTPWAYQTATTYDGVDAVQSGTITNGQTSTLTTTITGDNQVSFWWKVSSEPGYDFLTVYVDGVPQTGAAAPISGEVGWTQVVLNVPGLGAHTVNWVYSIHAAGAIPPNSPSSNPAASNSAWLDQVVVTPAVDADGDGFNNTVDCDDTDPAIHAGLTGYSDQDGDGWTMGTAQPFCSAALPSGYIASQKDGDCVDTNLNINPGVLEIPTDGIDQDCSGRDATVSITESLDNPALTWTFAGSANWDGQASTLAHDGVDAAESGVIGDGESSELATTVTIGAPNTRLSFWWRVSSEQDFDLLTVYVDDVAAETISGEVGWTRVLLPLAVGSHTIRWAYHKDVADAVGMDEGWVDQVVLVTADQIAGGTLAASVDAVAQTWTTGGDAPWSYQTDTTYDGVDAAQGGAVALGQTSWLETTVSGDNQLSFWWRVSSEPGYDLLSVSVDGVPQGENAAPISGEQGWSPVTVNISGAGSHAIRWQYTVHGASALPPNTPAANPGASNSAWLDQVVVTPAIDNDGDGFLSTVDCDDNNAALHAALTGYADQDGDTWTTGGAQQFCTAGALPTGYAASQKGGDCQDTNPALNPGVSEILNDGIDQDCSGRDATASIAESLDNPALSFTFAGNANWDGQATALAHDGVDGAQSGIITHGGSSGIQTTINVTAPTNDLSFWWRVSSEQDFDLLTVYVDGVAAAAISGEVGWTQVILPLAAGQHTIRWVYSKDEADTVGADQGWLDQVVLMADQAITVTTPAPAQAAFNDQFTVAATAPGGAVAYSSGSPGICSNNGALFTMVASQGSCLVRYEQAGSLAYHAATQVTSLTLAQHAVVTGGVQINNGAALTKSGTVSLTLSAHGPQGVKEFMVSNDGSSYQTFAITPSLIDFSTTIPWDLAPGDGPKTVYVKYGDTPTPSNVYGPFTADITLDSAPPVTQASPLGGTYNGAINVVLGSEPNATIYYSTGSAPLTTGNGQVYSEPITIAATALLQYLAVDQALNQEVVQSQTYTIAGIDLTGSVQINSGAAFTNNGTVSLQLTAADPNGVKEYMLSNDGINYQTVAIAPGTTNFSATVPWDLAAGDGLKRVYVKYVDTPTPNNVYGPFIAEINVDTTLPVTTATPGAGTHNGAINVVLVSEPGSTIYYSTGAAPLTTGNGQVYTVPLTIPVSTTLQFFAVDQALNQEATQSLDYTIAGSDLTGSVQINKGAALTKDGVVNLTLVASDPNGIKAYMLSNNGVDYQTVAVTPATNNLSATVPWTLSGKDGLKTVYVKYVDTPLPNNVYGPFTAEIILDTTPPVTMATPAAGTYNGAINVALSSEPGSTIYYTTGSAPLTTANGQLYSGPITIAATATLQFMAVDQALNQEAVQSQTYTIAGLDLTGSVQINSGAASTHNGTVSLTLAAADANGVKEYMLSNDGINYQTVAIVPGTTNFSATVPWDLAAGDGLKRVYVKYVDTPTPNNVYGPFIAEIILDTTVPVTTATPAEGTYNGAINVVLASEPNATIYYTTNPAPLTTANGQMYSGPITIPATATLQFFAVDQALNQEATQTRAYTIAGTDLTGSVQINNGAAFTKNGTVNLNLAAADPNGVKAYMLSNDGVNYQTVAIPSATTVFSATVAWNLSPGDGKKRVYVKYVDTPLPNNVYGPFTAEILLDTTLPVTTATPGAGTYNGAISVVLASEPNATIYYTTAPGPLTTGNGQVYSVPITISATATLQFFAVDQALNQEAVQSRTYTIAGSDLTGSVVINNGAAFTHDDTVALKLAASDPLGVKAYMLSNDGVSYQTFAITPAVTTFTATVNWPLAPGNGLKTVYVKYVDTPTPNNVYGPFTDAITLDTVAPVTTATPPSGTYNGAISVVLASEPGATIYYSINSAPLTMANGQVYTGPITIAATATLQFMAVDQAMNQGSVQTRAYTIAGSDLTGSVEINNGAAFTNTTSVNLTLNAADPAGVKAYMLSNDGVSYQTVAITSTTTFSATVPWTLTGGDGAKTVFVKYVDTPQPNNVYGPFTAAITLDTVAPVTQATPGAGTYNGAISVVLSSEQGATIYYSTNSAPLTVAGGQVYTGAITIAATATLQFMAVDQATNQEIVQTRTYTIAGSDLAGSVEINNGAAFTNTTSVNLTLHAADPAGVKAYMLSNDGVSYQTYAITATTAFTATVDWTLSPGDGVKTVFVKYVDTPTPNNVYGPFTAQITLDTVAPVTTATPAEGTYNGAINVVLASEPNATIYYTTGLDPLTMANGQVYSGPITIPETLTLQFMAVDQAGNQEAAQSRAYIIAGSDLTGSVEIDNGAAFTNSNTVNLTLNAADPAGVKAYMLSNDGVSYQTYAITATTAFTATVPWTLSPGDGVKTVYVKYVDTPEPNNIYGPFTAQITLDSVAPATQATPAEGTYNGAISVVLASEPNATIYYTTGVDPLTMATGQVYTGAITIGATASLQFMAVDQAGNQEAAQTRTYTIAGSDLAGSVEINNGGSFANSTAVTLTLAASDPAGVKAYMLSNDGVSYQTYAITPTTAFTATVDWTLAAGNGVKTVYVKYVDTPEPNNVYGPFTAQITLDTVAPVTTATPAEGTYNGAINVVLASEPNATIYYTTGVDPLTTAGGQVYSGPLTIPETLTLQFTAVDQAGNQEAVQTRTYTIAGTDLTGSVEINNGAAFTNSTTVNLALAASDPAGVKAYMLSNDGVSYQTFTITPTTAFTAIVPWTLAAGNGPKTVYVKYVDTPEPNNVYGPFTAQITVDTVAPVTQATPVEGTYNGAIDVVLASEPNAAIYYSTNTAPLTMAGGQVYTGAITIAATSTLQFMAVDQAGNQEAVQSRTYTIAGSDLTGSVEINSGGAFANSNAVTLTLAASDPAGVKAYMLSNDGVSYQTYAITPTTAFTATVDWTLAAGNGPKTVYVKYVDSPSPSNVYGPFVAQITLDTVAPVTTATPAEGTYNGAISVVLASEPDATIYYTTGMDPLTMAGGQVYTGAITIPATSTLQFMAVDQAGNQEAVQTRAYTIAGTDLAGSVAINNGAAFTNNSTVNLTLAAADPAGVKAYMLSNDGVSYQTYAITPTSAFSATVDWTLAAGNGLKTVYVKYVDTPTPNNVYGPFTAQITVDTVAPVTTATPAADTYNGAINVVLASEQGATIHYTTGAGPLTTTSGQVYSGPITIAATATLRFMAVDQAGNQEAVQSRTYTIAGSDLTGSVQINNGAAVTNNGTINLTLTAFDPAGVKAYMLSNDGVSYQTYAISPATTTFSTTMTWALAPGAGPKTVYVKYVDTPEPNNVYGPFTAQITLDTAAPVTTATPAAGTYNGAINVVLASEQGATIYYTTDTALLTVANGQVYSGPITIAATATLQFMAVDQAGNQEAVQTRAYTIAGTDLTGSVAINNGAAFTNSTTVNLALAASDPEGVKAYMLSNDGVSYQTVAIAPGVTAFTATVDWTLSAGDGKKTVYVKYVDTPSPNNVYGPFVAEITLDTVAPVTTATPAEGTYNGAINVVLTSEPKATIYYTTGVDPLTITNGQMYTGTISIPETATVQFMAVDQAQNQEVAQSRTYTIVGSDLTGSVKINNGAEFTDTGTVNLTLAATDPAGVKAYMLSNDGVSYQTFAIAPGTTALNATVDWTLAAGNGVKTVYVKYVDSPEPNNVYGPFTAQITWDSAAPVTTATPAAGTYNGAINAVLATEPNATIYYTTATTPLTIATGQVYTGPVTIAATVTLQFMAVDQAGNQEAVQTRTYTIVGSDLTGSVHINNGAPFTNTSAVTLTLAASDPEGVRAYMLSNDGVSYQTVDITSTTAFSATVDWTLAAGDGLKTVYVKYVDTPTPNNVYGPFVAEITVDTAAPVTQATPASGSYNGDINVVLASEPQATIYYTTGMEPLTMATGQLYSGAITIAATATLQFMAVDQAKNQEIVQTRAYTIAGSDLTGSVVINNGSAFTNETEVLLTLAAVDPEGVKAYMLSNDGESYQTVTIDPADPDFSATVDWTLAAGNGKKTVYVKYVDAPAPNNVYGPFVAEITLDTDSPVTTATPAEGTYNGAINVVLASEPNATIYYTTGAAPLAIENGLLYAGPIAIPDTATLQFMAVDPAKNQEAVQSRAYTIAGSDLTGSVQINNGAAFTNSGTVNLTLAASDPAGVKAYMLSNDGVSYQTVAIDPADPAFSATVDWTLSAGDGKKTVYVKYVDTPLPNNVYGPFVAEITLDTTAPLTQATPASGTYNGAINVVLASEPNATIYYTTATASLTMANGQVYTAPITMAETSTLQFMAVDQAGNQEAVQSRTYTIAGTDLTGSVKINNGAAFTNSGSVNLTLAASDPEGVKAYMLSNDGVSYQTVAIDQVVTDFSATVEWILSAGDGKKTVYVKYVDTPQPNNVYGPFVAEITVDTVAPATQATPAAGTYNSGITVVLTSEPNATVYYTTSTAPLTLAGGQVYTGPISIAETSTLQFMAVDQATNQEVVQTRVYTIIPAPGSILEVNLTSGWNLIASPEPLSAANLALEHAELISLWKFEYGTWSLYLNDGTTAAYATSKGFGILDTINPGEGFWLNAAAPLTLSVQTADVEEEIALSEGWNLRGLKGKAALSVPEIQALADGQSVSVVSIWKWSNNSWSVTLVNETDMGEAYASSKGFGLLTVVNPGEGIWINTIANQGETMELHLTSGWNLIAATEPLTASAMAQEYPEVISLWAFKQGTWSVFLANGGTAAYAAGKGYGTLATIDPGEGFWLNSQTPMTMTVPAVATAEDVTLLTGWNLLGLKGKQPVSTTEICGLADGQQLKVVSMWKWCNNSWSVILPGLTDKGTAYAASKGFTLLNGVNPMEGFWVNSTGK